MMSKQNQKGGDQSTNIQADKMVVQVGIDEKRAREVFQEMNLQLRQDYTQEALEIANSRVTEFEKSLMPKMVKVDGALEAFADPSFQLLLVDAQKTAACTERPADYDLLSELLLHRFQKGDNRIARAGINVAVDVVDKISDEALLGLTVAHAVESFLPVTGVIGQGLDDLNDLFGKIVYGKLPGGQEWLDHLEILNAIRLISFGSLKNAQQYYSERLPGYIDVGVERNSDNHNKATELLEGNNLPNELLVEHSLNPEYLRIPIHNRSRIDSLSLQYEVLIDGSLVVKSIELTEVQIAALNSIYDLYSSDDALRQKNVASFKNEWDKRSHLRALREWWDNIPTVLTITSAGKVLAHSNAQRCDKNLPPMN